MKSVPELEGKGIYTFDLEWTDIQSLTPQILNTYPEYTSFRNPISKNAGKLVTLVDFLTIANTSPVPGVL
ncbi:hypothetical protein QQ045_011262 [Rhodiola kirilowii]